MRGNRSAASRQEPNSSTKSWRDILPIHPAANLIPPLSSEEFKDLADDIKKNGLRVPVTLLIDDNSNRALLDGRHRLDALELAGRDNLPDDLKVSEFTYLEKGIDPYAYVISTNIYRRHLTLTTEQKRKLITKLLKATPEKSNRQIGDIVKADGKTVSSVRRKLEATAEIPQLTETIGKDGKARSPRKNRQQPATKTRRTRSAELSDRAAAKSTVSPIVEPEREAAAEPSAANASEGVADAYPDSSQKEPPIIEPTLRCSFCAKSQHEVKALIKGPNEVYICDECTDLCTSIVAERRARDTAQDESEVSSNFAKLVEAWKICTPEEQRRLLNQNNAIILTGGEGLLLIREFYAAALRDSDRQTRIRELRALLTAFDLTAHDLFLPADVEQVDPAPAPSTPDELAALRAALATKLSGYEYDLVNVLWALHRLTLIGELGEKNLPALIEAEPPFDYLGLLNLGRAIMDLGRAWEARDRRAQQHKPAQNGAAPPVEHPFADRRPGSNGHP